MKIELGCLEIDVEYDYQPEEPSTYWYPGCPEAVEITDIKLGGRSLPAWVQGEILKQLEEDIVSDISVELEERRQDEESEMAGNGYRRIGRAA